VCVCALLLALGCGGPHGVPEATRDPGEDGVHHTVLPGETVWRIAHTYGVDVDAVVRANRIEDVTRVAVGTRLFIPGRGDGPAGGVVLPSDPGRRSRVRRETRDEALREAGLVFGWPLHGRLSSAFGWRGKRHHDGIDLAVDDGTRVRVAEAGKVIYSGRLGAYGQVVVVKHAGRFSTVYAHNRRNLVRRGAFVEKGEPIAEVGVSGNATGPHLHFEIRFSTCLEAGGERSTGGGLRGFA